MNLMAEVQVQIVLKIGHQAEYLESYHVGHHILT